MKKINRPINRSLVSDSKPIVTAYSTDSPAPLAPPSLRGGGMTRGGVNSLLVNSGIYEHLMHVTPRPGREEYSAVIDYVKSDTICMFNKAVCTFEFENKLCRTSFRNSFATRLPVKSTLQINTAWFNKLPLLRTSGWKKPTDSDSDRKHDKYQHSAPLAPEERLGQARGGVGDLGAQIGFKTFDLKPRVNAPDLPKRGKGSNEAKSLGLQTYDQTNNTGYSQDKFFKRNIICFGLPLISADWICELLSRQLVEKKTSCRVAMNRLIRDVSVFMRHLQSQCPILGLRIVATGRLTKRKQAMGQKISKAIGKVPLSSFRHKIDYSQTFITTTLGSIGLKVWVCYKS